MSINQVIEKAYTRLENLHNYTFVRGLEQTIVTFSNGGKCDCKRRASLYCWDV